MVPLGTSTLPIGTVFTVLEKQDPGGIDGSFKTCLTAQSSTSTATISNRLQWWRWK